MRSPQERVQIGCVVAAVDPVLRHSQRPQLVTTETNKKRAIRLSESSTCSCILHVRECLCV